MSSRGAIVGALICQKDAYLKTLETEVVSCVKYCPPEVVPSGASKKSKASAKHVEPEQDLWLIECVDSVLFPEGGGQPTDHGTIADLSQPDLNPVVITSIQRDGLRCLHYSSRPFSPGAKVRQVLDFARRWDHMQQHTGQHILSAIMDHYDGLETLGWSMGAAGEMNYVELPRRPTDVEIAALQQECNERIRENIQITIETPEDAQGESLPDDYDKANGIVRVIKIGHLDANPCCGTHLAQTSHVSLLLLHHTQPVRSTNTRLYFTAGDRAIAMATSAMGTLRLVGGQLSTGSSSAQVLEGVARITQAGAEAKKREKRLLQEIATYEGERVKKCLMAAKRSVAWVHRPDSGLDFIDLLVRELRPVLGECDGAVLLVSGEGRSGGPIVVVGSRDAVEDLVARVKEVLPGVKGGGSGGRWQGKAVEWRKGDLEALKKLTISN